jgi:catechol 2,3-dioxygenase-like lactoylglutathione lyase family enzyme
MFTQLFPIVTTRDLTRALDFYRDLLDGRVSYQFPGPTASRATWEWGSGRRASASAGTRPPPRRRAADR